jgi:diguanylate cyclase (GGDEF)-like protein
VISAVVPIALAFAFAYQQVAGELRTQSERRLRLGAKAVGLELLERLQSVDGALERFAGGGPAPASAERIQAIFELSADGVRTVAGEGMFDPPSDAELRTLAEHRRMLRVSGADPLRFEVWREVGDADAPRALVAQLDAPRFFEVSDEGLLPPDANVCVYQGPRVLACEPRTHRPPKMPERGSFSFSQNDEEQYGHVYPLFLQAEFQSPGWTVLLSEPATEALAPVAGFRRVFPLAGLLSLILVALISIRQIRARLEPLRELQRGALRIAEQDFDVRVQLASGDEFEELADSFNLMAHRLRHQFDALSTLIEIDRDILEATEPSALVRALIEDLPRVCPCDGVMMVRFDGDLSRTATARVGEDEGIRRSEGTHGLPAGHHQRLQKGEVVHADLVIESPPYLEPLRELGMSTASVLPMRLRGVLMGVVVPAWRGMPPQRASEDFVFARRVADQAAVALDSAHVHEENRTLAYFDPLTELPNRLLFRERLEQALLRVRRQQGRVGVCMLDLDGFKHINDTLGHSAGDRLLQLVAKRAQQILRTGELARLGGDEFTILFSDLDGPQDVARAVERLLELIARPFELDGREVGLTASVGIAIHPEDGADPETLVKNADVAMYHAKEEGRNNYQFFSEAMTVAAMARMQLEQALRHALERGELHLAYQPIVTARDHRIVGAEALMRWDHPDLGPIPPTEFIPVAEEAGLIVSLGDWALREATEQVRRWQAAGTPIPVSVNISPRQFRDEGLVAKVGAAVERVNVDYGQLTLEITEGLLMENEQWAVGKLAELKRMGVKLAIDDFGTGYSSFSYLKHFPVDCLKLDRCFVRDLETNEQDGAIVQAMIQLGHSLGMYVVAEGVERPGQEGFLVESGCDRLQGNLLGLPATPDELKPE